MQALEDLGARGCCRPWCISFPTCFPLTPCFQISTGINRMRLLGIIVCNGTGFFCVGLGRSTAFLYTAQLEPAAFAPGGGTGGRPNHATGLRVSHRTPYTLHHVTCVYIGALIPIGLRNPYRVVVRSQGGAAYMHRKCLSHHRRQRTCLSHHLRQCRRGQNRRLRMRQNRWLLIYFDSRCSANARNLSSHALRWRHTSMLLISFLSGSGANAMALPIHTRECAPVR